MALTVVRPVVSTVLTLTLSVTRRMGHVTKVVNQATKVVSALRVSENDDLQGIIEAQA